MTGSDEFITSAAERGGELGVEGLDTKRKGFLDSGYLRYTVDEVASPDTLTRIRGVTPEIASALNTLNVSRFSQISDWSAVDVESISSSLGLVTEIQRQNWIEQAHLLAQGKPTVFDQGGRRFTHDYGPLAQGPSRTSPYDDDFSRTKSETHISMTLPADEEASPAFGAGPAIADAMATDIRWERLSSFASKQDMSGSNDGGGERRSSLHTEWGGKASNDNDLSGVEAETAGISPENRGGEETETSPQGTGQANNPKYSSLQNRLLGLNGAEKAKSDQGATASDESPPRLADYRQIDEVPLEEAFICEVDQNSLVEEQALDCSKVREDLADERPPQLGQMFPSFVNFGSASASKNDDTDFAESRKGLFELKETGVDEERDGGARRFFRVMTSRDEEHKP